MYFKQLLRERLVFISLLLLILLVSFDFTHINLANDFFDWLLRSLVLIIIFVFIERSFVNVISKFFFQLTDKLLKFDKFHNRYRFTFTSSNICVKSPLGELRHKWSNIEKVILTKNFLFLYIKDRNNYIISISKKEYDFRKMEDLIVFLEKNVTHIIKV